MNKTYCSLSSVASLRASYSLYLANPFRETAATMAVQRRMWKASKLVATSDAKVKICSGHLTILFQGFCSRILYALVHSFFLANLISTTAITLSLTEYKYNIQPNNKTKKKITKFTSYFHISIIYLIQIIINSIKLFVYKIVQIHKIFIMKPHQINGINLAYFIILLLFFCCCCCLFLFVFLTFRPH